MEKNNMNTTITLTRNLIVTNDGLNYTLQKVSISKNGKHSHQILGHYASLEKAIIAAKSYYTRSELNKVGDMSIDDAVSIIVRSNNHFESLIKNAFEGVTT